MKAHLSSSLEDDERFQIIAKDKVKGEIIESGDTVGIHWGNKLWFSCACDGDCDLKTCPGRFFHHFIIPTIYFETFCILPNFEYHRFTRKSKSFKQL